MLHLILDQPPPHKCDFSLAPVCCICAAPAPGYAQAVMEALMATFVIPFTPVDNTPRVCRQNAALN